jgi:hypothetical protein
MGLTSQYIDSVMGNTGNNTLKVDKEFCFAQKLPNQIITATPGGDQSSPNHKLGVHPVVSLCRRTLLKRHEKRTKTPTTSLVTVGYS